MRAKRNGIINIAKAINIKTFLKMEMDCQKMVIRRCFSEIFRDMSDRADWNREYTFFKSLECVAYSPKKIQ